MEVTQMRPGWSQNPKTLADRNDELNNILIEPWCVNSMKGNLAEQHYGLMKEIIQDLRVETRFYEPSRPSEITTGTMPAQFDEEDDHEEEGVDRRELTMEQMEELGLEKDFADAGDHPQAEEDPYEESDEESDEVT